MKKYPFSFVKITRDIISYKGVFRCTETAVSTPIQNKKICTIAKINSNGIHCKYSRLYNRYDYHLSSLHYIYNVVLNNYEYSIYKFLVIDNSSAEFLYNKYTDKLEFKNTNIHNYINTHSIDILLILNNQKITQDFAHVTSCNNIQDSLNIPVIYITSFNDMLDAIYKRYINMDNETIINSLIFIGDSKLQELAKTIGSKYISIN